MARRKRIAVLIASMDREYQQDFAKNLLVSGRDLDMDICIFNSQGHTNVEISTSDLGEGSIYDLPDLNQFDGVISLLATMGNEVASGKVLARLDQLGGKPHVSIDVPLQGAVTITFDDRKSVQELTRHLIEKHGVRRVAFVCGPLNSNVATARLDACRETMAQYGLTLENDLVFDGQWTRIGGQRAAEELLRRGEPLPDAVVCANDDMALSICATFMKSGIHIPQDVAVTGFDALQEAVTLGLTTQRRPIDRCVQKALEVLNDWIDGRMPAEWHIVLDTVIVPGETCGCLENGQKSGEKLLGIWKEKWEMEALLSRVGMYSGLLSGVGELQETNARIHRMVEGWGIRNLWICVNPDILYNQKQLSEDHVYPERMLLLYGRNGDQHCAPELFSTRDLLPVLNAEREEPGLYIFCPLYYGNILLGYAILDLENTGEELYPMLNLISSSLMDLYLQVKMKQYAETIEQLARNDIMTGMLNRRGYMESAPTLMDQARREHKVFAMLSADMDHMKDINDQYGHLMGDEAIVRMGRCIEAVKRCGMIPVHISGDEFLAYGIVDSIEDVKNLTPTVREAMAHLNETEPWICDISASMGLYAAIPREGDKLDEYMTRADRAMYADKYLKKHGRQAQL